MEFQEAICHECGTSVDRVDRGKVSRTQVCEKCASDVHVCANCKEYDPSLSQGCLERNAEHLPDKNRANFCDYFYFVEPKVIEERRQRAQAAKKRALDLFGED